LLLSLACSKSPPAADTPRAPEADTEAAEPAAPGAPAVQRDQREVMLGQIMRKLIEGEHLLHEKIDDDLSRTAFTNYLDRLDGTKVFLLASDRKQLEKYADKIDDELRTGAFDLAHEGQRLYVARVTQIEAWVGELLAKPFDHGNEEFAELDPKKLEPAATESELKERWRQRLELEVLERIAQMEQRLNPPPRKPTDPKPTAAQEAADKAALAQIPPTPEARDAKARADIAKSYAGRFARLKNPGSLDAASNLVNAVTAALDPHTDYMPPADKANFDIHMTGSLEGIGAVLAERDHYIEIVELVPGGASWRHGGLAAGDLILSVQAEGKDPVDVLDMRIDEVVKMVRGPKGTTVRLRLQKPAGNEETVAITRDVVVVEETYAKAAVVQQKGGPAYGYIHLPSFYGGSSPAARTSATDMHALFGQLKARKVAGVVIDIRSNGGGLLGDSVRIAGDLIDQGPVVQVQDSRGKREVLSDPEPGLTYDGPVIVLVDRFSASASEILAGALQDYRRALIVGTGPTHGKGTVQTVADLDRVSGGRYELGSLKLTIQQFFRVSGSSTQREGVTPDVLLPDPYAYVESGERTLDHAIAWSQISPAPYAKWAGAAKWDIAALGKKSAARVAKQPVLARLATTTHVLKTRRDETRVPLARTAWEARRKELRSALEAAAVDSKATPVVFGVTAIPDPQANRAPDASGKADDRIARWSEQLSHDPWVDESLHILDDLRRQ
jgi:carboxyl-terminal processing protease